MNDSQPHILMCPPDFYGIHYEINPWMDMSRQAEHAVAESQWHALRTNIIVADAKISLLEPVPGLPDLVFTANAAMIFHQQALLSRFSATDNARVKNPTTAVGLQKTASK